ncbi:hypothetical protein [Salinarimonas soli]|uniref:Uncharacterized protein n=1 Tax=Salinarimonas soli TaxID=1638099 RepID=A0A5B2VHA6_9HYPH|nr:hypothetical protein [Salinarimonas soli]KAA2237719.1 hypothetical protein F0L46_08555 [Salinarimonas soli]
MGRKVRRVPADWRHPMAFNEYRQSMTYVPLLDGDCVRDAAEWDEGFANWRAGLVRSYEDGPAWVARDPERHAGRYSDWAGTRPSPDDYMPDWPAEQRTHLMMYEDTTEGTPISPAFATAEELARWLADNDASAFGGFTATYEEWLHVARQGSAPSMVVTPSGITSGVAFVAQTEG